MMTTVVGNRSTTTMDSNLNSTVMDASLNITTDAMLNEKTMGVFPNATSMDSIFNTTMDAIFNTTIGAILNTTSIEAIFSNTTMVDAISNATEFPSIAVVPFSEQEIVNASLLCATSLKKFVEPDEIWFCISIVLYATLSLMSGLYSALTSSFFSLDLTRLELCIRQGSPQERLYAYRVIPLLKSPHMLLVTLNVGNVAAIVCLPVLLNFIVRPAISILLSAFVVLIFNKVLPQVIGDRHGLALAGIMTWFVYLSMFVFFLVAWPVALLLSVCLGTRKERFYQRSELIALMELQMTSPDAAAEQKNLSPDEVLIIKGALDAGSKVAMDAMIPLDELSPQIPVQNYSHLGFFNNNSENIGNDDFVVRCSSENGPRDRKVISETFDSRGRPLHSVSSDTPLYDILDEMNVGFYSIAAVYHSQTDMIIGVLTLQNVLDVILGQSRSSIRRDSRRMTLDKIKLVQSRRQLAFDRRRSLPEHAFEYVNLRMPEDTPLIT